MRDFGGPPGEMKFAKIEAELPEVRAHELQHPEMYRLLGDPELKQKDFDRYSESAIDFDLIMEGKVSEVLRRSENPEEISKALRIIELLPEDERLVYIEKYLAQPDLKPEVSKLIRFAPENKRGELLLDFFKNYGNVSYYYSDLLLDSVPVADRLPLVLFMINENNHFFRDDYMFTLPEADRAVADEQLDQLISSQWEEAETNDAIRLLSMALALSQDKRTPYILSALDGNDDYVAKSACSSIDLLSDENIVSVMNKLFDEGNEGKILLAIGRLYLVSTEVRKSIADRIYPFMKAGLLSDEVQRYASRLSDVLPEQLAELMILFLDDTGGLDDEMVLSCLDDIPPDQLSPILSRTIRGELRNMPKVVEYFDRVPKSQLPLLQEKLAEFLRPWVTTLKGAYSPDLLSKVIPACAEKDAELFFGQVIADIEERISSDNHYQQDLALNILTCLPLKFQQIVFERRPEILLDLQNTLVDRRLYRDHQEPFLRENFLKDGSELTLLDRVPATETTLRDRVIIRHIGAGPFIAWQKLYEADDTWKAAGFDYIPVEPIVKVEPAREFGKVDVYSRVLRGTTIATWQKRGGTFRQEIEKQRIRILETLQVFNISHGHAHPDNFMVCFEDGADGLPDILKAPRVYLIDFDQAVS